MKDIKYILNDCLNKAMCQKNRVQKPNSNNIADFVDKYLQTEKLTLSNEFKQEIKEAIKSGVEIDYGYDGVDEYAYDTFDEDVATNSVIEVLNKYLETTTPLSCKNDTGKLPAKYCQEYSELDGDVKYCTICGKDL